jgi:hypothetical protein
MSDPNRTDSPSSPLSLSLPPIPEIEREVKASLDTAAEDPELAQMADAFVHDVLAVAEAPPNVQRQRQAIDGMGIEIQRQAAHRSAMLQTPIRKLAHQGDEGGPVAKALIELRGKMQDLDPAASRSVHRRRRARPVLHPRCRQPDAALFPKVREYPGSAGRDHSRPGGGSDMLRRDNLTLADDQEVLRALIVQLRRQIELGQLIDARLISAAMKLSIEDAQRAFIEEELLFPLRQRILDLQQQLAVSQQGVLALEVVIRNNRELVRGVDRAINVTVSALNVAVTTALALANQRLVLDRIEALNTTTSDLIAGTAQGLAYPGRRDPDPRLIDRARHGKARIGLRRCDRCDRRGVPLPPRGPAQAGRADRPAGGTREPWRRRNRATGRGQYGSGQSAPRFRLGRETHLAHRTRTPFGAQ